MSYYNTDETNKGINNTNGIVDFLVESKGFKRKGQRLERGECPVCKKKEAWAKIDRPHYIYCNRKNKCGVASKTYDFYPQLYKSVTERFESKLDSDPNAIAKAYLQESRGFDITILTSWFTQSWINIPEGNNPKGRTGVFAVRFQIAENCFFERYVETIKIKEEGNYRSRNNRIVGSYKGLVYQPPEQHIEEHDVVYITEGVIKTIALELNGYKSVSSLSAGHFPEQFFRKHRGKKVQWVFALDHDKAGKDYTRSHVKQLEKMGESASCIFPYPNNDWDDLHKKGKLTESDFENFAHYGAVYLADSAQEKGNLIFYRKSSRFFVFDYDNEMYAFDMSEKTGKAYDKNMDELQETEGHLTNKEMMAKALSQSKVVSNISNCKIKLLYSQKNEVTDELFYFFQVTHKNGLAELGTMTGAQIDTSSDFRKRLKSMAAGGLWFGDAGHIGYLMKGWMRNLKRVQTQMYSGYNKDLKVYVYNDFAVKDGRVYPKNKHDFFQIGKSSIKGVSHNVVVKANTDFADYSDSWFDLLYRSFGTKGIVALGFWLGTLYSQQIRKGHKSYPFLEMIGEGGCGKSTLLEFMWKLIGREDYEGFNPSKNTNANVSRNFDSLANSPVALIEADHEDDAIRQTKSGRWNWDDLKDSWNGRPIRGRAVKTNGNEILEQPFRGAIVVVQNPPVNAERPILQRFTHLEFDQSTHTRDSYQAAQALETFPAEKCSGWLVKCIKREGEFMTLFNKNVGGYLNQLLEIDGVKEVRIAKNHAQLRAMLDCLRLVTPMSEGQFNDAREMILDMAVERQKACSDDHPIVEQFWEIYEYIDAVARHKSSPDLSEEGIVQGVNHHSKNGFIAINLRHFETISKEYGQTIPDLNILKKYLKSSKKKKFIESNRSVHSKQTKKPVKCWIFDAGIKA